MHDFLEKNISKKCLKKTVGCLRHFCVIFGLFCALSVQASVNAGPTSGSTYSGYSTNTTVNAKGTRQTKFTTGGKEYLYEQTAAGKTGFKDATTGKYTSRPNMPPATTAQPGSNLPATTA